MIGICARASECVFDVVEMERDEEERLFSTFFYLKVKGNHKLSLPANSSLTDACADSMSVLAKHWYIPAYIHNKYIHNTYPHNEYIHIKILTLVIPLYLVDLKMKIFTSDIHNYGRNSLSFMYLFKNI